MQELLYLAARLIHTARRLKLAFGYTCPVVPIFRRLYTQLACISLRSLPRYPRSRLAAALFLCLLPAVFRRTACS